MDFAKKHFTDKKGLSCALSVNTCLPLATGSREDGHGDSWLIKGTSDPCDFIIHLSFMNNHLPSAYDGHELKITGSLASVLAAQWLPTCSLWPLSPFLPCFILSTVAHGLSKTQIASQHSPAETPKAPCEDSNPYKVLCVTSGASGALLPSPASFLPASPTTLSH